MKKQATTRSISSSNRFIRSAMIVCISFAGWAGSSALAEEVDLGIENDVDYTRLMDAIRAAEYVREDYIIQGRNPRVVASVTALSAYALLNPLASQAQLTQFVSSYDNAIMSDYPGDPNLYRTANFMSALRFNVIDEPGLEGTNTHVGSLAAEMLNVVVPAPDNFDATQRRMVRFGQGLAMRYTHHHEFAQLLVHGFFGVTNDGVQRQGLSAALEQYLTVNGYEPNLGAMNGDTRFDEVNAGLSMLPSDFASYSMALNQSLVSNTLVSMVDSQTVTVQQEIDSRILTLDDAIAAEPTIEDGLILGQDQAVLDQLAMDLRDQLRETSAARSSMFGATFMLGQSPLDELGDYSTATLEYNAVLLEASDSVAEVQIGLGILTNLATVASGYASGDPIAAMGGMFGLVSNAIGIADQTGAFGNTASVDEQIYDQLMELRMQVQAMQIEMNQRFDRIELQLTFMYDQMVVGFNAIGNAIGDLAGQNDAILRDMHIVRSQLSQLESALFGFAEELLLEGLMDVTNEVLDYRDENSIDLAYANLNPNFVSGSEDIFTFATLTARGQTFAGSRSDPQVRLATADQYLSANPIARYLNDLAVLPQSLGLAPLTFGPLAGPEPWAQAASAYAQLATENPWYFAFRYQSQLEDYLSDPQNESLPELDEIIATGQSIVNLGNSARNPELFDALVENYKQQVANLQSEIDAAQLVEMVNQELGWTDGNQVVMVDLWDLDGAQGSIDTLFNQHHPGHQPSISQMIGTSTNWGGFAAIMNIDSSLSYFQRATIVSSDDADHANRTVLFEYLSQLESNPKYTHELRWDSYVPAPPSGSGFYVHPPIFEVFHWVDTNQDPNVEDMQMVFKRRIDANMELHANFGGPIVMPLDLQWDQNDPQNCAYPMFMAGGGSQPAWRTFEQGLPFGNVQGLDLQYGNVIPNYFEWAFDCANWMDLDSADYLRFLPYSDVITDQSNNDELLKSYIIELLAGHRENTIRPYLNGVFADTNSAVSLASNRLDDAVALLNAYITLAAPESVEQSEILRSAFRAAPGQSEIGLRANDVVRLALDFQDMANNRSPGEAADPSFDFHVVDQILNSRIDLVHDEINLAISMPLESPPYIEWMLKELNSVRDQVFAPARDDMYSTGSALSVDSVQGLMANDILQEYRTIIVDPTFGLAPANGSVAVNFIDGSFDYTPDAGFSGSDTFTYRLVGSVIEGLPNPTDGQFVSDAATVVIIVESSGCSPADFTGDGRLNFFDVSAFLQAFTAQEPRADFTGDERWNFFDVSAYLAAFSAGCP